MFKKKIRVIKEFFRNEHFSKNKVETPRKKKNEVIER